jgi:hypothetical protein
MYNNIWVWVNTYRYMSSGMNIHLPAILGFTRYQGFDPSPYNNPSSVQNFGEVQWAACDALCGASARAKPWWDDAGCCAVSS